MTEFNNRFSSRVVWHQHSVSNVERSKIKGHQSCVLWFTGLSGSGKSSIANALDRYLYQYGVHTYVLDGDNVRYGLNVDLGFSDKDRVENIRRISEVAKLFVDSGLIVLTAFISPFADDRAQARSKLPKGKFLEIFIDTPLEECERRDPKGLYSKARLGEIKNFTGIDSVYQSPEKAEIHVKTQGKTAEECALEIVQYLYNCGFISLKQEEFTT